MTIVYGVKSGLYVNLTNRCPCACTFCIRKNADKVYEEPDTLWLEHEPSFSEVRSAFEAQDMSRYTEVVFCGYGEPTEALDVMLETAAFVKEHYKIPVRLNTNGSALQIGIKMNYHEGDITKSMMMLFGGILFMIGASIVMPALFGYQDMNFVF